MPTEAQGTTAESAGAFVRYYLAVLNEASSSGDTGTLASLKTNACQTCRGIEQRIQDVYRDGGFIRGDGYSVIATKAAGNATQIIVSARLEQLPLRFQQSATSTPSTAPRGRFRSRFTLDAVDGTWRLSDWKLL